MSISSSLAVSMMIGTWLRLRIRRQTSIPSSFGQHDVEDDEVEPLLGEPVERIAAVLGRDHVVALLAQRIAEQGLNRLLVVDEQDAGRHGVRGRMHGEPCAQGSLRLLT